MLKQAEWHIIRVKCQNVVKLQVGECSEERKKTNYTSFRKLTSDCLIEVLWLSWSQMQHSWAGNTTQKSRQYSDTHLCYQVKIELHTGLDTSRLFLYAKLSSKQATLRKWHLFKPHRYHAFQEPYLQGKLNSIIKVNECLLWHDVCRKLDLNYCSSE